MSICLGAFMLDVGENEFPFFAYVRICKKAETGQSSKKLTKESNNKLTKESSRAKKQSKKAKHPIAA